MERMERSKACCAKAVSLSNVTDLRRAGLIRPNTASRTEMVSAAVFPASLVARVTRDFRSCRSFMQDEYGQDEYGPRALADDEVAFPVTHVGAAFDVPWPIVDGGAVFDHVAGGSRPARPAALVTAGQIAPQFLALASGAIDEGVDGFEPQGAQGTPGRAGNPRARRPRSWPALSQPAICSGVHPSARRSQTKSLSLRSLSRTASRRLRR